MAENKILPGPLCGGHSNFKEAVCISANGVYDSCKDKDCLEDLPVCLTRCGQAIVDKAINVRCRKAEIIWVYIDVENVPFNRGFYSVDIKYFFKITLDAFIGVGKPHAVEGLATFDKKVILFGSEGTARIFSSKYRPNSLDPQMPEKTNMPKAVVEVVDPICLDAKVVDPCERCCCDCDVSSLPDYVCRCFEDEIYGGGNCRRVYITLGLFSIVRLERPLQLLVPAYDFCMPEKECVGLPDQDPCSLFSKLRFPQDEFFPPKYFDEKDGKRSGCCG